MFGDGDVRQFLYNYKNNELIYIIKRRKYFDTKRTYSATKRAVPYKSL